MIAKKHITPDGRLILAVCDTGLLGKLVESPEARLDLGSDFFNGDEMGEEALLELMKRAYILNIAGEQSVGLAVRNGLVEEKQVLKIGDIPHAQAVMLTEE
jgi:hypothetical protein